MKQKFTASINLDKMELERLYQGKKGKYLNVTIFINEETDRFGSNGFVVQQVSAEDFKAGKKGAILGNIKKVVANVQDTDEPLF